MVKITLRQLHYFDVLVRVGHFGRAADACAVSQSALSVQIQDLEKQLGVVLIERNRKGIALTQYGEEIARRTVDILTNVRDLVDHARQHRKPLDGVLRFGVIPTVAPYLLPPLLPLLRDSYPTLELQVRETQTAVLLAEIVDGKLDVGLVALPVTQPDLQCQTLFDENFLLAVPPGFQGVGSGKSDKVKGRTILPAELLKHERLLLLEEGHCFRDQALDYCNLQEVNAGITLGLSSFATIVRMVANGYGFTLLPEMAVATEVRDEEIRLQSLPEPQPKRTLGLVWRKTSPRQIDFAELAASIVKLPRYTFKPITLSALPH
jgi:LysR family transcriptional regulator, hydrogen peroxide-inducible genes activator